MPRLRLRSDANTYAWRVMATTIYEAFSERAASLSDSPALLTPGKADTTFGELLDRTALMRTSLARFGITRGTRVGLVVPTRDAMATAHLAVVSSATSAPLSALTTPQELEFNVSDFRLKAVILERGLEALHEKASTLGVTVVTLEPSRNKSGFFDLEGDVVDETPDVRLPQPDDTSILLHTSGTTSRPKIVARTQARSIRNLGRDRGDRQPRPGDRIIDVLPLHHTQGLNAECMTPMMLGVSIVMADFDPASFINLVEEYRPTKFTLVPSMHRMVVDTVRDRREMFKETNLRYIESSSAGLPVALRRQMEAVYGVPIIEGYGATELGGVADMGFDQADIPEGSVGKRRHDGVVIMDDEGNILPPAEHGEICVKSPDVISGYENNPEANAAAFRDGYYRTGDEGYLDENDYLFVVGRVKETINRGGEKIAPAEVDEALLRHEGIAQAAAFGCEHPRLGQDVWAAVVPKNGAALDPAEVRAFVSRILSFPRVPKRIFVVDELPHNEIGKVMRRELSEKFGRPEP